MSSTTTTSAVVVSASIAALAGFSLALAAARAGWLPDEFLPKSRKKKITRKVSLGPGVVPAVSVAGAASDSDDNDDDVDEDDDDSTSTSTTTKPLTSPPPGGVASAATINGAPSTVSSLLSSFERDVVVREQLTRNRQFFGSAGQSLLANSLVVVVGLGGVGSHAAAALLRSGVGRLRLVDFDQVTLSSLNRHAVAERKDVGIPKATCLKNHFRRIMPEALVDARVCMFDASTADSILASDGEGGIDGGGKKVDFVVDAIDNVPTKVELLRRCVVMRIPAITVTGAGAKRDPTRLRVTSLGGSGSSRGDKLAKAVRHRLARELRRAATGRHRRSNGGETSAAEEEENLEAAAAALPAVVSDEAPWCGLVDVGEEEEEDDGGGAEAERLLEGEDKKHRPHENGNGIVTSSSSSSTPRESIAALRARLGDGHPSIAAAMEEFRAVPGFRVRALPVLGPTPAAAGLAAAAFVLCHLAGHPVLPAPPEPRSAPHYQILLDRLVEREEVRRARGGGGGGGGGGAASSPVVAAVAVDVDDVAFLVKEVWRGVSAVELCSAPRGNPPVSVPGGECGLATATARLTLCKWRNGENAAAAGGAGAAKASAAPASAASAATVDNLVLLTFEEAEAHERGELVPRLGEEVVRRIEAALERVREEYGPTEMTA